MRRLPCPALLLAIAVFLVPLSRAAAQESIQFGRTPDISPDGKLVAFSYLGDIWTVSAEGGEAKAVTMHPAHDIDPSFSPDGKWLAFSSNRHGQYDVFVVPVQGGKPKRLTFHSSDDHVCGWSPDGKYVLFTSKRSVDYPFQDELYRVPVTGGKVERITFCGGRQGAYSPDGKEIAYVRGPGAWFRKGYKGSASDDIWICGADGKNHRQLTKFDGQDNYPCWSADGKSLYYVTDAFGTPANIVCQELASGPGEPLAIKGKPKQITFHKDDGVRQAKLSRDGNWLVYECGPDLWVAPVNGGPGKKLKIAVHADDKINPEKEVTFTSGVSEFAVSPNEKAIAFVVHGEVFLVARGGGKATRLTNHPANDHGLVWAPDSKSLLFLSDRFGQEDIFQLVSDDAKSSSIIAAAKFKEKQLTNSPQAEMGLNFSPDGKRVSFLREGKLCTMNPDGSDVKTIVAEPLVIDYEWSPDSKWICYSRLDGSYASELFMVPAAGPTAADPIRNISQYATYNAQISWSKSGQKIAFVSERGLAPEKNVYLLDLQKPAVPGITPGNEIDWEDIHLRTEKLSGLPASRAVISPDGKLVAFRATSGGDEDLWVAETDGSGTRRITKGNMKPSQIQWSGLLPNLIYFLDASGSIQMAFATGKAEALKLPFTAKMTVKQEDVFKEIFEQSWRFLDENFYDAKFHGVDWKSVRDRYRPLLKHVILREDLNALISLMMGELNASHLGLQEPLSTKKQPEMLTPELGLLFDESFAGPGLKIAAIVAGGPADKHGLKLKPGDIIHKIDGVALTEESNLAKLLNGKTGELVSLEVSFHSPIAGDPRQVEVQAVSRGKITPLMYQRWVKHNAQAVKKLSNGKLGYIHIPRMDEQSLDQFLRLLYSDNFEKEAIVLDVRFNSGGNTHDAILTYLNGKVHTLYYPRHGTMGTVFKHADRKWTKPLTLLINSQSFSSAEVFASGFHTLGLGKLVGAPTGGHVIGTGSITLIDGSLLRLPRIGVFTTKGINMEKQGVEADVFVENNPNDVVEGNDAQLQKAVEVLLQDLAKPKANPPGIGATK